MILASPADARPLAGAERVPQLPALTGLRFFAALLVIDLHFGQWVLPPGAWHTLATNGAVGVSCFFVLSGFILAHTYIDGSGLRGSRRSFYVARFARIYPVYALGLLIGFGPYLWQLAPSAIPVKATINAVGTVSLLQAWIPLWHQSWNGPSWSVSAEACFYALFPLLAVELARCTMRGLLLTMACCWLCTIAIAIAMLAINPTSAGFWTDVAIDTPLLRLPEFMLGMAAGIVFGRTRIRPLWSIVAGIGALVLLACLLTLPTGISPLILRGGGLAPLFALLILALAWGHGPLSWLLGRRPLVLLGEASYSLYILHFPLHDWLAHLASVPDPDGSPRFLLVYLALLIPVSLATHRLLEQPARRILRRVLAGTAAKTRTPAPASRPAPAPSFAFSAEVRRGPAQITT